MLIVFTTTPDRQQAESLAEAIVNKRLAACVQILPEMTSFYFWEGKVQKEPEHLLLIKTLESSYEALEAFILENHSYDEPEIVAVEASEVSEGYLKWLEGYVDRS
ncbi:MAG: divalent-cation tolerance protein CutA [Acidobacteriota bacterium]|nr:MAG: divalent-cation tolerance protein CutA [Acidobacteriota bacterium]